MNTHDHAQFRPTQAPPASKHIAKSETKPEAKDDLKSLPLAEVENKLGSSPKGLTQAEATKRLTQYGPVVPSYFGGRSLG